MKSKAVRSKKHHGSSLDDFLKERGTYEQMQAVAIEEVIAWQLREAFAKSAADESPDEEQQMK